MKRRGFWMRVFRAKVESVIKESLSLSESIAQPKDLFRYHSGRGCRAALADAETVTVRGG